MADATTEVTLEALHAAIVAAIRAQFPDLRTVEFYRDDEGALTAPACLLELTEMEAAPELDPGTEQLAIVARFEARLVLGYRTPQVRLAARVLAAAFAAWLRLRRWPGVRTGPAEVIGCYRDEFEPRLDQFEVWRVEWTQLVHLGETVWKGAGAVPQVLFSIAPEIGVAYKDRYRPLEELL